MSCWALTGVCVTNRSGVSRAILTAVADFNNTVVGIVSIQNVSADMSSGFLQVFFELGSLYGTSNHILYLIHGGRLLWFR